MIEFIKNLFGDKNERQLKKLWPIVDEINEHCEQLQDLTDDELRAKTDEFRRRIKDAVAEIEARQREIRAQLRGMTSEVDVEGNGALPSGDQLTLEERQALYDELDALEDEWYDTVERVLDELLPEAFAVIKDTCRRMLGEEWEAGGQKITWDMVPYDVQLLGGIVLHQGNIAEMKTGEGKTLVAVLPVYLNALVGRGVHLVTVNPYLAQRDAEWMGPIYEFHGLTVDVVDKYEPHSEGRRKAYRADVTFGTNNEFGFDYLRDHSFVVDENQLVQREHYYAIIDEIDSVLVDEARTPLIISGPVPEESIDRFKELKPSVERLVSAQKRLVAELVREGEELLEKRDELKAEGKSREASELEEKAGLLLFRATRGFPKNKKLQRLINEPGVGQLIQRTEAYFLRDSAKHMHIVDDELYFALDEKQHAIEMTDKGRELIAKAENEDIDLFVLPDIGSETAEMEEEYERKVYELEEDLEARDDLDEEKRQNKLMNDRRLLEKELEEKKRELYNTYSDRAERLHAIEQLLKAYTLYERDIEYIVQEGRVQIVDKHTGRVLSGRRYSQGLHQAIEAKEEVEVQSATQTYATITLQNYFRMYEKLAGMTGTAETEAEEFHKIYGLDVVVVPTNEPVIRDDKEDLVFRTKREKYNAVIDKIKEYQDRGQPVLVGTASVEVSETLSRLLKRNGIKHNVLNARRDRAKQESLIVAEAGQKGAVTIATNMAGRGTDIKLGPGVKELGGLAILGTERHESRRIDLQLRGRAGRQGDPGESQFYVSLEDDLMRLFGSDRIAKVMDRLDLEEGAVITHSWVTKSIERAQKKVEQNNFAIRKRQLEYDDVLNNQRQVIYARRMRALKGDRFHGEVLDMLQDVVEEIVGKYYAEGMLDEMREEILRTLAFEFEMDRETFFSLGEDGVIDRVFNDAVDFYHRKREALAQPFHQSILQLVESDREKKPERIFVDFSDGRRALRALAGVEDAVATKGHEINDALERTAMLTLIDEHWTQHLRKLDEVKEGIGLRSFARQDPLVAYKLEAFDLFKQLLSTINYDVVSFVFRAGPLVHRRQEGADGQQRRRRLDPRRASERHDSMEHDYSVKIGGQQESAAERDPSSGQQTVVIDQKIGRNDRVTIQNMATGETATLKYKYAQEKLDSGWSLVSVEDE